jgi:hypothetical protein
MTSTTVTLHQRTVRTVQTLPPAVCVEATLVAAHRLLNNPLLVHASPLATEQWHHDVDQLIVTTINTPQHEGGWQEPMVAHSRSPSAMRTLTSACVPHQTRMLPSITMADLR